MFSRIFIKSPAFPESQSSWSAHVTEIILLKFVLVDLWLEWIEDEMPLACITEQKTYIHDLFEKAVKDYQCM